MKKLLFVIFLCSFFLGNAQRKSNINGNLVGYLKKSDFLNEKHKDWFSKNYSAYTPDPKIVQKIKKNSTIFQLNLLLEVGAMIVKENSQGFIKSWN